jgi:hypothetical protein
MYIINCFISDCKDRESFLIDKVFFFVFFVNDKYSGVFALTLE